MKVRRTEDNALFTLIDVMPWPEERMAATVSVTHTKRDAETGAPINSVKISYGPWSVEYGTAYEYAMAILRACDIARQLEINGVIILEGE